MAKKKQVGSAVDAAEALARLRRGELREEAHSAGMDWSGKILDVAVSWEAT